MPADGTQGNAVHDIVDAWVYVDGQLIGAFEMPSTIPILASGTSRINVFAGIKNNGLNNQRIRYPLYRSFDIDMELTPGKVDTLIPTVVYNQNAKFSWLENFEDGTISTEGTGTPTTHDDIYVTSDPADVFEYDGVVNTASGRVDIPNGPQLFETRTIQGYELPRFGQDIYLELNFKCNTEMVVGMYALLGTSIRGYYPVVNLFSTVDETGEMQWKKVYVSLAADVNNPEYNGAVFKPFFRAQTNSSETLQLFVDNIKLVHF